MRTLIASIVIAAPLVGNLPALAQGSPSADQIINSLRPTGNLVQGGTRGIRVATPAGDPMAQAVPPPAPAQLPRIAANKPVAVPVPDTAQSVVPQPAAASQPAVAAQPAPQPAAASAPSVNLTVNFETGSAGLTPDAMHTLDALGRALASQELASYRFRIEGHTDTVGSREYNRALSERRAIAVVEYVAKKYGVEPSRLQAVGMGQDGLLVATPEQTAEPRNRRVQVINLGA